MYYLILLDLQLINFPRVCRISWEAPSQFPRFYQPCEQSWIRFRQQNSPSRAFAAGSKMDTTYFLRGVIRKVSLNTKQRHKIEMQSKPHLPKTKSWSQQPCI